MAVKVKPKRVASAKVKRGGDGGGLGTVQQRAKEIDKKKSARNKKFLKIDDGESVALRVLDVGKDFKDGYVHPVEFTYEDDDGKERTFTADVMCLDQNEEGEPCPGCRDGLDRRYKFWTNVIARDWETDDGSQEDTILIWSSGITVAKKLDKMNARHPLIKRDIILERDGKGLSTTYDLDWADEEDNDLSEADEKLAEDKADLSERVQIREHDDFYKSFKELNDEKGDTEDVGEKSVKRGSAFGGKKKDGVKTRRTSTKGGGLASVKARANGNDTEGTAKKVKAKPKVKVKRS